MRTHSLLRYLFVSVGVIIVVGYGVVGALLMNEWAVVAASGVPLEETIAAMDAAGQPYSTVPGLVFVLVGALLAVVWAILTSALSVDVTSVAISVAAWAAIIAFGAPAFFFASFSNMNSVGDTFFDWDAEAAFALEVPLYLVSATSVLVGIVALLIGVTARRVVPHPIA
jgi:hypothetical protein